MRYDYLSSFEQFKRAQRTYVLSSGRRHFTFHLQLWGLFSIGCIFLLAAQAFRLHGGTLIHAVMMPIAVGMMSGGAVVPLMRPWSQKRCYRLCGGDPKVPRQVYVSIDGPTLVSGLEGKSEGRFQRGAVCDTAEDDAMLLLLVGKKRFLYFPKAQLPAAALDEIGGWLQLPGAPNAC